MEVAILPHGSGDEAEFESRSGLNFVLCHKCTPFPQLLSCAGCKSLELKIHPFESDSKVLLQFIRTAPTIYIPHATGFMCGRERLDLYQRLKGLPVPL
jgi:hypothetical protein